MTSITAACTCSVDGVSGWADTRYAGYSFTGCGAHVDYTSTFEGGGYERIWCYVTSPPDCPGESPYIPEGFKTDNTLPEWEAYGAAWKECYDGYRCEAWWGGLEGLPDGEPVVLDAPLDWPDCCALCSGGGSDDGDGSGTNSACVAWSFDPSTGSCQRMSTVEETSYDYSWEAWKNNSTVNGYPGYFEAPLTDCWGRTEYDLCVNTNGVFIVPGVVLAFVSLVLMCLFGFFSPSKGAGVLKELLLDEPESSRLEKAACVKVACTLSIYSSGKGRSRSFYTYEGTFVTRDGAVFVVPPAAWRPIAFRTTRKVEQRMLAVLYNTNRNPRDDPSVASSCQTPDGLRAEFSKMAKAVPKKPLGGAHAVRGAYRYQRAGTVDPRLDQDAADYRYDCILLMDGKLAHGPNRNPTKVLLVGILGEDLITCIDREMLGSPLNQLWCLSSSFVLAAVLLLIMCITLLTNEAAQVMAARMFEGDYRVGAVIGLVLCTCVPLSIATWKYNKSCKLLRSMKENPLVV